MPFLLVGSSELPNFRRARGLLEQSGMGLLLVPGVLTEDVLRLADQDRAFGARNRLGKEWLVVWMDPMGNLQFGYEEPTPYVITTRLLQDAKSSFAASPARLNRTEALRILRNRISAAQVKNTDKDA